MLDSSLRETPKAGTEETARRQDPPASRRRQGRKRKVHSLMDKVYSRKNLELAWEKVKKNRGAAGCDYSCTQTVILFFYHFLL
jgi:hypothetical protein